jgi:YVTN family beta-propeller protein
VRSMTLRELQGRLPRAAARARVTIRLATTLPNIDGPFAPEVGFNRAVADDVHLSLGEPVAAPAPLRPPAAHVPRYRHVFLFYFENQDVDNIVGDRKLAPYYNRLRAQGASLDQMYAEEHPSDGNYLALAGGSVFGLPLDDPPEENSQYTIHAPNIADRIDAAHESWKVYDQSAAGPCDDTVHRYHWDDDQPMLFFADVRDRPAYCARHVVPLEAMGHDLAHASTTPNFVWVGINDCVDMEGCGIQSGDRFLAKELGQIMRSPAWRTQRSLAIVTFDEDRVDHERPAQRIPTVVLASHGVRRGYVSHRRDTHYSLLRTIEGALGLRTLTNNDRFAQPLNDIFSASARGAVAPASPYAHRRSGADSSGRTLTIPPPFGGPPSPAPEPFAPATAFVASSTKNYVTPITLATSRKGKPIKVGRDPAAIALSPDDLTAYVVNSGSGTVTPIDTATRRAGRPIRVGRDPRAIAITPDGRLALVADSGSNAVTPINLQLGRALKPIAVGAQPRGLVIAPDGLTAYVLDWGGSEVTPIYPETRTAGRPLHVGGYPSAIAIARGGRRAYVTGYGSDTVTPIALHALDARALTPIPVGAAPDALALTPSGATAEVVSGDTDTVSPVATAAGSAGRPIPVGSSPNAVTISRSGATAYVVNTVSGTVTPIDVAQHRAGRPISVGRFSYPTQIALAPHGPGAVVTGTFAGTVRLLNTRTRAVSRPITVGGYPTAVAITG